MKLLQILICAVLILSGQNVFCETPRSTPSPDQAASTGDLDGILKEIEKRYAHPGFSARFYQVSVLKDMQIEDTASGTILIKRPGMMRWEYEKPERQTIITDGKQLWIYRPEDRQVMIGKAPDFFGDGKGASFLTDIRRIRHQFGITLQKNAERNNYLLKLDPRKKTAGLSEIYLSISKQTFEVVRVVTLNAYGDETRIELSQITFLSSPDDDLFHFVVPEGTDVLELDG